ncbi:terminase gpA endonuclease subunit [Methylorubrum sp. DB1722]|uniref:terminase gpA endonuclease subunit n=1 Tax=Methylorubrum sp. DB1722 TaxID=2478916 RepID=UPI0018E324AE|nr:terminase gpA endonuclease subunit [Methylorubrum sp. DB1722]MBI1689521.1 hypothetical protein [Methylorubrum sp. DB1722]
MQAVELDPAVRAAVAELALPGFDIFVDRLAKATAHLVPNPFVDIVDWIEANLVIPNGNRRGPVKLDVIQRIIARAFQKKGIRRVVYLKPPRAGSSTLLAMLLIYFACWEAQDVIFYERATDDAQDFHDKKLLPILLASEALRHLVRDDAAADVKDAWADRYLSNGAVIQLRGVQIDGAFKAIRGFLVAVDEAGDPAFLAKGKNAEGNKVELAGRRAAEYFDPRLYVGGTPTTPECVVAVEWERTDKNLLFMPFPCCDWDMQPLLPNVSQAGVKGEIPGPGLKYRCDDAGRVTEIGYECANPACRKWLPEQVCKVEVMERGEERPTAADTAEEGHWGIATWAIHAKDPQSSWSEIVKEHRAQAKDPTRRQNWVNLWLAQAYTPKEEGEVDPDELEARCEDFPTGCPDEVEEVFVGIDTQEGSHRRGQLPRHEAVLVGVGRNEEKVVLARRIIDRTEIELVDDDGVVTKDWEPIDPFGPDAARQIWALCDEGWTRPDGTVLYPKRVAVDIGYLTQKALAFCKLRESRRRGIIPVKGRKEAKGPRQNRAKPITRRPKPKDRSGGIDYDLVGTQGLKDHVDDCLRIEPGQPYAFRFSGTLRGTDFFAQLTAEVLHRDTKNPDICWWGKPPGQDHVSNEVLDCVVYALAAMVWQSAKSPRTRTALAMDPDVAPMRQRQKVHGAPAPSAALSAIPDTARAPDAPLNGAPPRPEAQGGGRRPLSGVRRVSGDAPRPAPAPPSAAEAGTRRRSRFDAPTGEGFAYGM